MAKYNVFHLKSPLSDEPIEVKLNMADQYVRIASPYHELIQLRHQLFNPNLITVANSYGSPLFQLHAQHKNKHQWTVQKSNGESFSIGFQQGQQVEAVLTNEQSLHLQFSVLEANQPTPAEMQMIGAALAACHLNHQFATSAA